MSETVRAGSDSIKTMVFDACVIGGGPSGAVAAALLAEWGCRVVMIHREPRQRGIAESLPGSTRKLFGFLGLLPAVDSEAFESNVGNISEWAGASVTTRSDAAGYHVDRARFDAVLRRHAGRSGVLEISGVVRDVEYGEPSRVACQHADGSKGEYLARFVLDCSGRAGVIARRLFERTRISYRTLAYIADWGADRWPAGEAGYTVIASYPDGWVWSVPVDPHRRQCAVMLDPELTRGNSRGLTGAYAAELTRPPAFARRLSRARQLSGVWSCDATVYQSRRCADAGVLLVGDAASFVEPLSSAGVRKAITSAWRAAVVVNTCLRDSSMMPAAAAYFDERERHMYATCLTRAGEFFATAAREHDTEFWRARTRATIAATADNPVEGSREHDVCNAAHEAFRRLREASSRVRFIASDRLRFASAPEIEGRMLTLREGVVLPGESSPTLFVGGVQLATLTRLAIGCHGVESVVAQYERRVGLVAPNELVSALTFLISHGALVLQDPRSDSSGARADASGDREFPGVAAAS